MNELEVKLIEYLNIVHVNEITKEGKLLHYFQECDLSFDMRTLIEFFTMSEEHIDEDLFLLSRIKRRVLCMFLKNTSTDYWINSLQSISGRDHTRLVRSITEILLVNNSLSKRDVFLLEEISTLLSPVLKQLNPKGRFWIVLSSAIMDKEEFILSHNIDIRYLFNLIDDAFSVNVLFTMYVVRLSTTADPTVRDFMGKKAKDVVSLWRTNYFFEECAKC